MKRKFLLTGHTGFKGSWLAARLVIQGHSVAGFSDKVRPRSLHSRANFGKIYEAEFFSDVRRKEDLVSACESYNPDTVIHLAAQPIVLTGYAKPLETFETNFNGTVNVIEACKEAEVSKLIVVTTDKVYLDDGREISYSESDKLGGFDPYAASKAAADIATQSYISIGSDVLRIDIVRGGNVIGGGDDSLFRLVPDLETAISEGAALSIRNPEQIRPWQHALDCLDGYLAVHDRAGGVGEAWNIGPSEKDSSLSVSDFIDLYAAHRNQKIVTFHEPLVNAKETAILKLNTSKMKSALEWEPTWDTVMSVRKTAEWFSRVENGESPFEVTMSQVENYSRDRE